MEQGQRIERESMFYQYVKKNPTGMALLDDEGRFFMVNAVLCRLLGYREEELTGRRVSEIMYLDQEELTRSRSFPHSLQGEKRFFHKRGHSLWVMAYITRIENRTEGPASYVLQLMDNTDFRNLLVSSEKLSVIGELAAGVAHEIRNPLTSLRGFVQLMQGDHEEADKKEYLRLMMSEIDRINTIVGEMLLLSRPKKMEMEEKDLHIILSDVVRLISAQAILYNVEIVTELACDNPQIRCEENKLKQVFINLLKNAVEAMPNGGVVRVQTGSDRDAVLIRFIDEGCGMPKKVLEKAGEAFFTTKDKGTGLGLMVSYNIIENHNGKMKIQSEVNKGTTIEIYLPVKSCPQTM